MSASSGQPEHVVDQLASLADATRLRLLRLLEGQELGVVELCDVLQLKQSTVSNHLKVLIDQGWLVSRRQGTINFYRMLLDELESPARQLWLLARAQTDAWATAEQDRVRLQRRLRERADDTRSFFAGAAGEWDKLRADLYGDSFVNECLLAMIPPDHVVADLGCGTGALSATLATRVASVIAVDNSPAMLEAAEKRLTTMSNVELLQADLENLPLASGRCDVAVLTLVLTYLVDPMSVLMEATRILKPGGRLLVVDLLRHDREDFRRQLGQVHNGFDAGEMARRLTTAGLSHVRTTPIAPEQHAKGPALFLATGVKTLDLQKSDAE